MGNVYYTNTRKSNIALNLSQNLKMINLSEGGMSKVEIDLKVGIWCLVRQFGNAKGKS